MLHDCVEMNRNGRYSPEAPLYRRLPQLDLRVKRNWFDRVITSEFFRMLLNNLGVLLVLMVLLSVLKYFGPEIFQWVSVITVIGLLSVISLKAKRGRQ